MNRLSHFTVAIMPLLLLLCSVFYRLKDNLALSVCCIVLAIVCWLVVYGETKKEE